MKWYIPREHGAWAMFIVPYWIGASITGINLHHGIFFLGLLSIYFAQAPLLTYLRQPKHKDVWPSFIIYMICGSLFALPYIWIDPQLLVIGLFILPFFCVNLIFAKLKKERLFINDVVAITALSGLLLFSYRLGHGVITVEAFHYVIVTIAFFTGSVFHVKSLLREKGNVVFRKVSTTYHVVMVIVMTVASFYGAAVAFLVSLLKTLVLPKKYFQRPMQIGVIEIINSSVFFVAIIVGYYYG
ncbi:hypothetical protein CR194_10200 [Salipaludibacillus keqinensis]|uniref:YwiC-like family protein n=1 Tax=Salipaludibacillus keqinensis TaxID=2045207 RepID=A0A323TEV5_9BACI|nr:YwiC-like family protein [Salipaludibacillus keqinensis]PYZ93531.1 hypothetical protein CR194_10200 [Salipaludibacillus keqinensis]